MDILKRTIAPISEEAWVEIERQARLRLEGNLSARRAVDFSGPHGWRLGAVNLGRLDVKESGDSEGVPWGIRQARPLVETRIPVLLELMELDSVSRGLKNPDLRPLEDAACRAARFEERSIYLGFEPGRIKGMAPASPHEPIPLGSRVEDYQELVERGVVAIQKAGIGGPFMLALGTEPHQRVMAGDQRGYPLRRRLEGILQGGILWSPALEGGVLFSAREGNFLLTVGQDFSIGYVTHTRTEVELFITESYTFEVLEPAAAVEYRLAR